MAFDIDIFISYAHIDNLTLKEGEKGWIASFHKALEVRLAQLLGEKPRIWRDKKLQGNDFFGDEIVKQFPGTALMLSIISPRYIKSEWCTREVKEFYKAASKGVGTRIGSKSRVFKIIKTAVPFNQHPREIADTLGYEFFVTDTDTGKTKELHEKSAGELEQMYWGKLDDIAHDIRDLLLQLKETITTPAPPPEEQLTVYLAETTYNLKDQRDMIKRQLQEYGYRVLPDTQLPFVESEFKKTISNLLDQSALSVHLVGGSYGLVPEGSKKSIIILQNELAAQKSKTGELQRLIWLLADGQAESERQKEFIGLLRSSPDAQYGADLFETSIEDFKSAVLDKLNALQAGTAAGKDTFQSISTVYLAEANFELQKKRESIKRRLMEGGCKVLPDEPLPLICTQLYETVGKLLAKCDVSIHLFGNHYGVVPEETVKSISLIQHELAGKQSEKGKLECLVWTSPIVVNQTDERQRSLLNLIKTDAPHQSHTVLFETSIDEMETALFEKLESIEEKRRQPKIEKTLAPGGSEADEADRGPRQIYLICDRGDLENQEIPHLNELEDFLFDRGFDVVLPIFEGKEEDMMNDHHENLRNCDAVIIYYGSGSEFWLRSISRDITKIAGYGRKRPILTKAVFLSLPFSRQKAHLRSHDFLVIRGIREFSPSLMEPFLEKLK